MNTKPEKLRAETITNAKLARKASLAHHVVDQVDTTTQDRPNADYVTERENLSHDPETDHKGRCRSGAG